MKCFTLANSDGTGDLKIETTHVWTWAGSGGVPEGTPCDCGMVKRGDSETKEPHD